MSEEQVATEEIQEQTQEEVVETPDQPEEPESFMDSLFQDLGLAQEEPLEETNETVINSGEDSDDELQQETNEEEDIQDDVRAEEEQPEQDEPEEKPKKKVTYKAPKVDYEEIRRTVREEVSKQQPTPQPPTPQQQAAEPEPAEDDLVPEQLEELELARFAEKKYPDKYKGQAKKLLAFYKKLDDYAANSDEDRTFDEDDTEFVDFVQKNKPKLTNQKRLEREMIADLAAQQVSSEKEAEIADLKEKMRVLETKPTVEKKFSKFTQDLQKAGEQEDEFSASIYEQQLTQAENMGREYLDLYYGMKTFNGNDPSQKWIVDFVTHQSNVFQQKGGKYLSRDGKTFMTPADFAARGNPSSNWTFGPDDVLQMFNNFFTNTAKKQVESEYSRLEKMGFTKAKAKNSAKKGKVKEEATPITAPKAKTAKSPGAAESGDAEDITFGEDLVKTLGMDFTPSSFG